MYRHIHIFVALAALSLAACTPKQDETKDQPAPATPEAPLTTPPPATGTETPPATGTEAPAGKPDLAGEEVSYEADGVKMKGYLVYDKNKQGKRPGVLVVHEWWGNNDYARKRADMLAELGYTALAVDMYGDGKVVTTPEEAQAAAGAVYGNLEGARARFQKAQEILSLHDTVAGDDVAAIGYCFGGGIVLHMARTGADLDGVASFHGSLTTKTPAEAGKVEAKVLVLHGAADPMVPPADVEAFKKEMDAAKVDYTFKAYEGATHAFTNPAATEVGKKFNLPVAYDATADQQSWDELKGFLEKTFAD
jgi:dienelactone hydrolase